MNKVRSVEGITDPYIKRILSNIIDKDPMEILRQSPKKIIRATKGLTKKQLQARPEGKWSIGQIIAHLCDAEIAMSFRLRMSIAQSGCTVLAYDENKWAEHLRYEKTDPKAKIAEFASLRQSNLAIYKSLTPAQWNNFGVHEERGKETVERLSQMMAGHDVNHVRRIEEIRKIVLKGAKG